jgi:hypothetical protein
VILGRAATDPAGRAAPGAALAAARRVGYKLDLLVHRRPSIPLGRATFQVLAQFVSAGCEGYRAQR